MRVMESGDGVFVRLERGEEIHPSLTALAADRGWRGAAVTGIGAVDEVEVGFYHLDRREYERRPVPGILELLSLTGNLSLRDGTPFLHAHVVLMDASFALHGGHLFRARIAVTGEFSVRQTDLRMVRVPDEGVGLPLLEGGPEGAS
jgi:predicted DNA-binding protein with PD1-like motif